MIDICDKRISKDAIALVPVLIAAGQKGSHTCTIMCIVKHVSCLPQQAVIYMSHIMPKEQCRRGTEGCN